MFVDMETILALLSKQHGATKHTDVTRELFIPALDDSNTYATLAQIDEHCVIQLTDAQNSTVTFKFKVPDDFVSFSSLKLVWTSPAASGNLQWKLEASYGANGETY